MIPVVTSDQMRAIDAAASEPVTTLIDRAGAAVARAALRLMGGSYGRTVTVLAGPGNNGADGRVAAARLRERGVAVRVYDAVDVPAVLPPVDLVIDAAFGTGFHGSWSPPATGASPVLAVDIPTGLDAQTGVAAEGTMRADATVTFAAAKPGHVLGAGPDHVGALEVVDIGLPTGDATMGIVEADDVARWLPPRDRRAHKWTDAVRVVAGTPGLTGAAHLVAAAAQRAGAGLVAVSSPGIDAGGPVEAIDRRVPPFDWAEPVLDDLYRFHALVVGPGLGREDYTVPSVVRAVLEAVVPVVVDGDGLFALSWNDEGTPAFLREREVPTVLTPHDAEFGLLTGSRPGDDRIAAAHQLVEISGATVLLKGPATVVAAPDGRTLIVDAADERLATAGTGDVLAGIVGALLARGVPAPEAAAGGAWIHARAAARSVKQGLIASDVVAALPDVLEGLTTR
jgi:NAD(P)H-hydrate epimerase